MIGYKDMTFCMESTCADWKTCHRALTKEVRKAAEKWWGGEDYPIAIFSGRIECYKKGDTAV